MDIRARLAVLGCCVSLSRIDRWFSHAQQNEGELENVEEPPTQPAASATAAAAAATPVLSIEMQQRHIAVYTAVVYGGVHMQRPPFLTFQHPAMAMQRYGL